MQYHRQTNSHDLGAAAIWPASEILLSPKNGTQTTGNGLLSELVDDSVVAANDP